jgi:hypothetical protein
VYIQRVKVIVNVVNRGVACRENVGRTLGERACSTALPCLAVVSFTRSMVDRYGVEDVGHRGVERLGESSITY